jgi:hypothetical protein
LTAPVAAAPITDMALDQGDELRAQYVACSYLATACQEALAKFPELATAEAGDPVTRRALEFLLAVEWDWRLTLQELGEKVGRTSSFVTRYNPEHAEDADPAGQGAPRHRPDYRRRPSVRRRL